MSYQMKRRQARSRACAASAIAAMIVAANASADLFDDADRAARESRLADMQAIYEEILLSEPTNVRALTGKGAALAWQGQYSASQESYLAAINLQPDNVDALVGLGYAYAWAGEYPRAHTFFNKALQSDPYNVSARKGIGYTYLWSGQSDLALGAFDIAESIAADDAEIAEASGHAQLSLGHARDAIESFRRAEQLDPQRTSAISARRAAFATAPALEVSAQYGSTSDADSGLRSLEVAHWPSRSSRISLRYDNSLSLDNRAIIRRGEDAPGYYAGIQQAFGTRWQGAFEFGQRQLPDGDQRLVSASGVFMSDIGALKFGAQLGRHESGYTDQLFFGGVALRVAEKWQIEPTVYASEYGPLNDREWRAVMDVEFQPGTSWRAGLRFGRGDIDAEDNAFSGATSLYGIWSSVDITDQISVLLSVQQEDTPGDEFVIARLGFTYRLPRN